MVEPEDLLGKADALMARHHPGRTADAQRAEVPVLDEVVDLVSAADDLPLLTEYVVPAALDQEQVRALAGRGQLALHDLVMLRAPRIFEGL